MTDWPAADPTSPYFCHGPTLISFSGGRTSAYMLYMALCAHGGALPSYVYVTFCNTGKEREETLRFVHECGSRWGVHIHWLEWIAGRGETDENRAVGCNAYRRRMDEVSAFLGNRWPVLHMMRGTAVALDYPFHSADSTSLAQNGHRYDSPMDEMMGDRWRGRRAYADRLEGKRGEVSPARHVRTKTAADHGAQAQPGRPSQGVQPTLRLFD